MSDHMEDIAENHRGQEIRHSQEKPGCSCSAPLLASSPSARDNDGARKPNGPRFFSALAAILALCSITPLALARADSPRAFTIEAQPLDTALKTFALQAQREIFFTPDLTNGKHTHGINGKFFDLDALKAILDGTGLTYSITASKAILVRDPLAPIASSGESTDTSKSYGKGASDTVRIAQNSLPSPAPTSNSQASDKAYRPAGKRGDSQDNFDEVVVTAQRRSQALLDVPMAVTALGSAQLESAGIASTVDLTLLTPNLQVINSGKTPLFYLRGIGSQNANTISEPSIAFYVDDVYYPDAGSALTTLQNVERVEVLAGPQGTLYGRNATGGLIHVVTLDPQQEDLVKLKVGYESYGTTTGSLYATGGLSDQLAASLEADVHHQGHGIGTNPGLGDQINFVQTQNFMGKILWKPNEAERITLAGRYSRDTSDFGQYLTVFPGTVTVTGQGYTGNPYDVYANIRLHPENTSKDGSVVWEHKFDNSLTLKSVTAYHDGSWSYPDVDITSSVPTFANASQTVDLISYQQEFVLQGTKTLFARQLDFTGGLFYFRSTRHYALLLTLLPPVGPLEDDTYPRVTTRSYSGFGQADYHLTGQDTLTAGVRYTSDKLGDDTNEFVNGGQAAAIHQDVHFNNVSWRLALEHKFTDQWMVYASASTGYKSGTFNAQVLTPATQLVRPETLNAYEVGSKVEFLDHRVQLNASGFYYDYKDLQVQEIVGTTASLRNAATAKIYGAELQSSLAVPLPAGDLQLRANASFLHARYTSFPGCNVNVPNRFPPGGVTTVPGDCSGGKLEFAPNFQGTLGINYRVPVEQLRGALGLGVTFYHGNGYFSGPDNLIQLSAQNLLNGELFYSFLDERARVRAYGTNLTNRHYVAYAASDAFQTAGYPIRPRIFGIEFDYSWR